IVAAEFIRSTRRSKTEKAFQKSMQRDGAVPAAAPDRGALKAELDIPRWLETDLFEVHPGVAGSDYVRLCRGIPGEAGIGNVGVASEPSHNKVITERPDEP